MGEEEVPGGPPAAALGLLRGVSAAWMGRMPAMGWGWPALGLCRGAMDVSMVGVGSVSLGNRKRRSQPQTMSTGGVFKESRFVASPGFGLTLLGHGLAGSDWLGELGGDGCVL